MAENRSASLLRSVRGLPSRRHVLRGLAGAGLALGLARLPIDTKAKQQRKRKPKRNKGLCRRDGSPCKKPGKSCQMQYCLRASFTIEASWTQTANHDSYLFVPPRDAATGPAQHINQFCNPADGCVEAYPFACFDGDENASGAEVATVHRLLPGTYEYWVELVKSTPAGAVSVVLKGTAGRVVRRWASPANPTGSRVGWHVFDIDGRGGRVTSIDTSLVGAETTTLPAAAHTPSTNVCPD